MTLRGRFLYKSLKRGKNMQHEGDGSVAKDTLQTPPETLWGSPKLWSPQKMTCGNSGLPLHTHRNTHRYTPFFSLYLGSYQETDSHIVIIGHHCNQILHLRHFNASLVKCKDMNSECLMTLWSISQKSKWHIRKNNWFKDQDSVALSLKYLSDVKC